MTMEQTQKQRHSKCVTLYHWQSIYANIKQQLMMGEIDKNQVLFLEKKKKIKHFLSSLCMKGQ